MFKPTVATTPEEYIAGISEPRRGEIEKIHKLIQKTVPDLKAHILAGMIGYGTYRYKYASGKEGDWSLIALASQKTIYQFMFVLRIIKGTLLRHIKTNYQRLV